MKTRTAFVLSLTAILTLAAGSAFGKYSGGSGTAGNPYKIATKTNLLALAADTGDYNKCFILTADINMTGQVFSKAIIAPDTDPDISFMGTYFTGTFDGNGHKITNFTIKDSVNNSFIGLFGYILGGSVKNLGIENCSVSGYYYVGCLAGYNSDGNIINCYSTGSVSGVSNSFSVGGLVGESWGTISDCYAAGSVSGASGSFYVGGLAGQSNSDVSRCYTVSSVAADDRAGGLVGYNGGNITNCYSAGLVSSPSGSACIGGLVAYNSSGIISKCYSMGLVSDTYFAGGLVGVSDGGSVVNSFWDANSSGQTASAGGTGKTSAQMKTLSTFTSAGWDFIDTWGIIETQTYPYLITGLAGDLNNDKKVDFDDFAIFAANWLRGE
ncbi:MAG: GLUG motif-containing protein [Phycisphaerae bacterium]|jgi:hypothetical protein